MKDNIKCDMQVYGISLEPIFTEVYRKFNESKESNNCAFIDRVFGKVSYIVADDGLTISFSNLKSKTYTIFKTPVQFVDDKENELSKAYNIETLKEILSIYRNIYTFLVNDKELKENEIINQLPSKVKLNIKNNNIPFQIFKELNNKKDIPEGKKKISLKTNELISQDIDSLGLKRDRDFLIILDKRNELIEEIKSFMDSSNELIMKIFGCDGIGKSISFIYLGSLKNNFRTVYFNLKEINNAKKTKKIEIFKKQILAYYTENIEENDILIQDDIYFEKYKLFLKNLQIFDKEKDKEEIDFWELFVIFKNNINALDKVLFIFDQYKKENDLNNKLEQIEEELIKKNVRNIKILISSSLNDMKVKTDFLNILKIYINNLPIEQNTENNQDKVDDVLEKESKKLFEDYNPNKNYLDINENDDSFGKIKIFKEIEEETGKKNINEDEEQNKAMFQKNLLKEYDININKQRISEFNKYYRIIYINDLISVKNYNEDEKKLFEKLSDFNFNPKYYNKFKDYCILNESNNNIINDLYVNFLYNIYEKIKSKIEIFYEDYNNEHKINFFSNVVTRQLINLEKLIHEKIILNLNLLIYYLNEFPIKYVKIYSLDKYGNKINKSILRINNDLSSTNFKIDYVFPFMKFIITRLIFDYGNSGNITYNDISSSGIGSLLEKQIRNAIINDNIFKTTFHLRNFWTFYRTKKTKKKKLIKMIII